MCLEQLGVLDNSLLNFEYKFGGSIALFLSDYDCLSNSIITVVWLHLVYHSKGRTTDSWTKLASAGCSLTARRGGAARAGRAEVAQRRGAAGAGAPRPSRSI